jgi:murein L,D-transpeptidase YcbB/YkuD
MIRFLACASVALAIILAIPARGEQAPGAAPSSAADVASHRPSLAQQQDHSSADTVDPAVAELREALRRRLAELAEGTNDEERSERSALVTFYEARGHAPLWMTPNGPSAQATALLAEFAHAGEWGLNARDFVPLLAPLRSAGAAAPRDAQEAAAAEVGIARAILIYGRYARGGRIIFPAEQLSSYLDRRPQLLKPALILEGIASAENPDAYLRGLNPQHPQFERLRQKYLALGQGRAASAEGKRLLANMEEWRWMPADLGALYVWNNIPEFLQRVVRGGVVLQTERIVAGEIGKQTPIFTRPMRKITFKPSWKVPDSIKVRELWPSLLRGGRLMREWELEVHTKDGRPVDWHRLDWTKTDIREYDVIQPNGAKSVLGRVKFSFPNPHTVFMHDTMARDRYMFSMAQRTYSHGCMRVHNPMRLAEILLGEEGWDAARVAQAFTNGPLDNEVTLEHRVPVHITYFTALVGDDGKLHTFPDVYGHERRIVLALEGRWREIDRGRDHLAPVELDLSAAVSHQPPEGTGATATGRAHSSLKGGKDILDDAFSVF